MDAKKVFIGTQHQIATFTYTLPADGTIEIFFGIIKPESYTGVMVLWIDDTVLFVTVLDSTFRKIQAIPRNTKIALSAGEHQFAFTCDEDETATYPTIDTVWGFDSESKELLFREVISQGVQL